MVDSNIIMLFNINLKWFTLPFLQNFYFSGFVYIVFWRWCKVDVKFLEVNLKFLEVCGKFHAVYLKLIKSSSKVSALLWLHAIHYDYVQSKNDCTCAFMPLWLRCELLRFTHTPPHCLQSPMYSLWQLQGYQSRAIQPCKDFTSRTVIKLRFIWDLAVIGTIPNSAINA